MMIGLLIALEVFALVKAFTPWIPWGGSQQESQTASLAIGVLLTFIVMFGLAR
jgi:hypothetical protein